MSKKNKELKTIPWKCGVCNQCKLIIEGPRSGYCIYGEMNGFKCYIKEDGTELTLEQINEQYLKNTQS